MLLAASVLLVVAPSLQQHGAPTPPIPITAVRARLAMTSAQPSADATLVQKTPVAEWLEAVSPGYGEKFANAFEEVGADNDASVIAHIDADVLSELDECLVKAGAKKLHLTVIHKAIASLKGAPENTAAARPQPPSEPLPSSTSASPLRSRAAAAMKCNDKSLLHAS